ncbi:MAG: hypothetical protein HC888_07905 [Candidatus Competibacteraceae bacterium]|nr:hypothetical protein [Candidatus Competibacteraceae bacterium]
MIKNHADHPTTVTALFQALAVPNTWIEGKHDPRQHYTMPWANWKSWKDARRRLAAFEQSFTGEIQWHPFNDSTSNDGPMTLNAFPGRAFIERVTNAADACLEMKAHASDADSYPHSPREAVELWFKAGQDIMVAKTSDDTAEQLARETINIRIFGGNSKVDPKDCILDVRDFGVGLSATDMPQTILSLNRGLKKSKPYLTGKHGQGASSTYQYSDLTLIASRREIDAEVAFTLVEASWANDDGTVAKTPTYRYLTVAGKIPTVEISKELQFEPGTLIRHIGYNADFNAALGEKSMYGLLMRSLALPLLPVWLELFNMQPGTAKGVRTEPGYRRYGRTIRGTVNSLNRAYHQTLSPPSGKQPKTRILHRMSSIYCMGEWEYGGRTGVADLGQARITYWVIDPADRSANEAIKNFVDPSKSILFTLDGQTHAEESRAIVTGQRGAKLWAVGQYMIVHVDCDELDPRAKYEMFTSTREHVKDTPIRSMIMTS